MARVHARVAGLVFVVAAMVAPPAAAETNAVDLIIRNARLIDGTNASAIKGATILVSAGRVTDVVSGPSPHVAHEIIDADGFTVVPGLVDAHNHLLNESPTAPGSSLLDREPGMVHEGPESVEDYVANRLPIRLRRYLEAGVTTLVDLGSWAPFIFDVRDKIEAGELVGPRLFVVGRVFGAPGGHPSGSICGGNAFCSSVSISTNDPVTARRAVDQLAERKVDGIKIIFDALNIPPFFDGYPKLQPEVMKAIIEQAHAHSLPAVVHVTSDEDGAIALDAGADALVHMPLPGLFSAETLSGQSVPEFLGQSRVPVVTTMAIIAPEDLPYLLGVAMRVSYLAFRPYLRALRHNDVVLVLGTDFSGTGPDPQPGAAVRREALTLVTLGFSEAEVIRMATGNTSRFPMLPEGLGTIAPGSVADLLLLPRDPLADIGALTSPTVVVKDGKIVVDKR